LFYIDENRHEITCIITIEKVLNIRYNSKRGRDQKVPTGCANGFRSGHADRRLGHGLKRGEKMGRFFNSNRYPMRIKLKVRRCLAEMEELGKEDDFFKDAVDEFYRMYEAGNSPKVDAMVEYLVCLYDEWYKDRDWISLQTTLRLCAYLEDD